MRVRSVSNLGPLGNGLVVGLGVLVLGSVSFLLLSAALGALTDERAAVWVNPSWARAGFGFAALTVCLFGAAIEAIVRGRPLNQGPRSPAGYAVLVGLALVVGLTAWQADRLTAAYAAQHGFLRCPPRDRLTRGNVRRNDVVSQAYVRERGLDANARAACLVETP